MKNRRNILIGIVVFVIISVIVGYIMPLVYESKKQGKKLEQFRSNAQSILQEDSGTELKTAKKIVANLEGYENTPVDDRWENTTAQASIMMIENEFCANLDTMNFPRKADREALIAFLDEILFDIENSPHPDVLKDDLAEIERIVREMEDFMTENEANFVYVNKLRGRYDRETGEWYIFSSNNIGGQGQILKSIEVPDGNAQKFHNRLIKETVAFIQYSSTRRFYKESSRYFYRIRNYTAGQDYAELERALILPEIAIDEYDMAGLFGDYEKFSADLAQLEVLLTKVQSIVDNS